MALAALVIILLVLFLLPRHTSRKGREERKPKLSVCPLCGSRLAAGERLRTVLYRSGTSGAFEPGTRTGEGRRGDERIVHIHGCPYCLGEKGAARPKRVCPVCRRKLSVDDYLLGWKGRDGEKSTVRITGCSRCRPIHI